MRLLLGTNLLRDGLRGLLGDRLHGSVIVGRLDRVGDGLVVAVTLSVLGEHGTVIGLVDATTLGVDVGGGGDSGSHHTLTHLIEGLTSLLGGGSSSFLNTVHCLYRARNFFEMCRVIGKVVFRESIFNFIRKASCCDYMRLT